MIECHSDSDEDDESSSQSDSTLPYTHTRARTNILFYVDSICVCHHYIILNYRYKLQYNVYREIKTWFYYT